MTKPWDNEPSPEADKSWMYPPSFDADTKVVSHEKFANLERRLRHAERLLNDAKHYVPELNLFSMVLSHLEAAKAEDNS